MSAGNQRRGPLITFEGGDGVGKSTQIARLAARLKADGHEVVVTREPGGSEGAEAIRDLLVNGDANRWSPLTEALLMYAARRDHLETVIEPARARGAIVLCDRFSDSTMAYQGIAGAVGVETIAQLDAIVVGERGPALTIILDAPADLGLSRAKARGGDNRFEGKGEAFQEQVRLAFLEIAKTEPSRCAVVNASASADTVTGDIERIVRERIGI